MVYECSALRMMWHMFSLHLNFNFLISSALLCEAQRSVSSVVK